MTIYLYIYIYIYMYGDSSGCATSPWRWRSCTTSLWATTPAKVIPTKTYHIL